MSAGEVGNREDEAARVAVAVDVPSAVADASPEAAADEALIVASPLPVRRRNSVSGMAASVVDIVKERELNVK